jgi:NAD(P)-dependent dehydrogenase (short-subunit alcohol dehydrogenase family)
VQEVGVKRTIVFTGATGGLGRIAAGGLLAPDVHLVLVGRSEAALDSTAKSYRAICPAASLDYFVADFTDLRIVDDVAKRIASRYRCVDTLVNNAGQHAFTQRITNDGFAEMMSTNYLAPWLLTAGLLPSLKASRGARVVHVASEASRRINTLDPEHDLQDTVPFTRLGSSKIYARTKLMNIMFSAELARRLDGESIVSNCLDPGFNVTGLGRELPFSRSLERMLRFLCIGRPERGADIIVRLSRDHEFERVTGKYFNRKGQQIDGNALGRDPRLQQLLWKVTEQTLARIVG